LSHVPHVNTYRVMSICLSRHAPHVNSLLRSHIPHINTCISTICLSSYVPRVNMRVNMSIEESSTTCKYMYIDNMSI